MGIDRKRRKFMTTAAAGVVGLSGTAAAQNQSGNATGNQTDAGDGEPESHEVLMVTEGSDFYFEPIGLHVQPGDTVTWILDSGTHSSTAYEDRIPEGAEAWDSGNISQEGAEFTYTFEEEGTYDYYCTPHQQLGMVGRIVCGEPGGPAEEGEIPDAPGSGQMPSSQQIVDQGSIAYPFTGTGDGDGGEGGGGAEELHDIGVPYHAHFVGLGAIFGVFASLIFAFYFLKYAESPEHKDQRDRR